MSSSPTPEQILGALRKSGYLMEQEVATELESLGLHVWTSWAFEDPDEGKSREIDVRAIKRVAVDEQKKISAFVEFLVECKNSTNPFVFLGRPKSRTDDAYVPQELVLPGQHLTTDNRMYQPNNPFFQLGFHRIHHGTIAPNKAVQFCRINRKNGTWDANHGGLFNSMFYPLAKALTARKKEFASEQSRMPWRDFWCFVPIVVTSGQIYYVDATDPEPSPQERDFVSFQRDIKSGDLQGVFAVDFVRQNRLAQFFGECIQPIVDRMTELTMGPSDFATT